MFLSGWTYDTWISPAFLLLFTLLESTQYISKLDHSLTRFVLLASGVSGSFGVRSSLFHLMFLRIDSHLHFLKGELCNTERDRFMVSKPAGSSRRAHIRNVKCVFFSFFASKREEKRP